MSKLINTCVFTSGGGGVVVGGGEVKRCRTDGAGIADECILERSSPQTLGSRYPSLCHSTIASIKCFTDSRFLSFHFFMT